MVNAYGEEFLGRNIKVVKATNQTMLGIEGVVVRETKNMFSIKTQNKIKQIPKEACDFTIEFNGATFPVQGSLIRYRPENRLKELRKISKNLRRIN